MTYSDERVLDALACHRINDETADALMISKRHFEAPPVTADTSLNVRLITMKTIYGNGGTIACLRFSSLWCAAIFVDQETRTLVPLHLVFTDNTVSLPRGPTKARRPSCRLCLAIMQEARLSVKELLSMAAWNRQQCALLPDGGQKSLALASADRYEQEALGRNSAR